jgi:hypothetical protein
MDPAMIEKLCRSLLATSETFEPISDPPSVIQEVNQLTQTYLQSKSPPSSTQEPAKHSVSDQKLLEALLKIRQTAKGTLNSTRIIKNSSHS